MPMWDDEDDEETKKLTPKQRLLGWIQNKVPQLPINNFNRDWQDGKALGALVDNCAPGKKCVAALTGWVSAESDYTPCLLKGLLNVAVFIRCYGGRGQACVWNSIVYSWEFLSFAPRQAASAVYLSHIL